MQSTLKHAVREELIRALTHIESDLVLYGSNTHGLIAVYIGVLMRAVEDLWELGVVKRCPSVPYSTFLS